MQYAKEFANLSECVEYLRREYPLQFLPESRDLDSGQSFRGGRFPRWLFRGESSCYPASRPTLWRFRKSGADFVEEAEVVTGFVYRYMAHHLVLPYVQQLDHFESLQWLAISAGYEAYSFCQHYGLPTPLVDFTKSLTVAAAFASCKGSTALGRIAVLDATTARSCSQLIDLQPLCATRATRQKAIALYIPRHADLCHQPTQAKLGIKWYRFQRAAGSDSHWQKSFAKLLKLDNDRLAGWPRHAVSMYVRQHGPLSLNAANYFCDRLPMVPLLGQRGTKAGEVAFQLPAAIAFDEKVERCRSLHDWCKPRTVKPGRRITVHREMATTGLLRFTGT